jgi:hypothetical protein
MTRALARPRFLLAVCRNMRWTDAGVFGSEHEAAIAAAQEETSASQIIPLRAGDDPQAVLATLRRALVITRYQGPDRRMLLVGFYFGAPNPLLNRHRRPAFKSTTDADMAVKFQTVHEARACLRDVAPFAPDATIRTMDWREPRP